jgi:hypothetical protein
VVAFREQLMDDWQWRVRIDADTDPPSTLGAGFLIDPQRVLTCAHLVIGLTSVRVSLPGGPVGLRAVVVPLTGWAQLGDHGDIALLRLEAPAAVSPARFAQPEGTYWAGELRARGFRLGFEQTGSYVTLRTAPDMTLAREWWQLDVDQDRPERLAAGFSGAAVYLAETGEVIGMVSDADLDSDGRMGRMLPLAALRRHWEDLDDLLPLPWLTTTERRELREIVRDATAPAQQAYTEAFPGSGPLPEFWSLWDAIRYVAEERFEEDRLARFVAKLAHYLPRIATDRLSAWSRRALGAEITMPTGGGTQIPASVIIRLERRTHGDTYELTLSSLINGIPGHTTPPVEVPAAQVREKVETSLPALVRDMLGYDWMIEFALPESWLYKAVEEWRAGGTPMLAYPVVVRDVERLKPAFRQDRAIQRWATLRERALTQPEPVRCTDNRTKDQYFYWLTAREDVCVLVHSQRPKPSHLTSALNAGIPVMVWPRSACPDPVHSECAGARLGKELVALVADAHPDELPKLVKKLRAQARSQPNDQPHCGRRLTLFWDDPARLPDPPLMMAP